MKLTTKNSVSSNVTEAYQRIRSDIEMQKSVDNRLNQKNRKQFVDMLDHTKWFFAFVRPGFNAYCFYAPLKADHGGFGPYYHVIQPKVQDFDGITGCNEPYHRIIKQLLKEEYSIFAFPEFEQNRIILLTSK